jgi:hypothetical protein
MRDRKCYVKDNVEFNEDGTVKSYDKLNARILYIGQIDEIKNGVPVRHIGVMVQIESTGEVYTVYPSTILFEGKEGFKTARELVKDVMKKDK